MTTKELTLEELLKLISTKQATASQKLEFSKMLTLSVEDEVKKEKESKLIEIDNFIINSGYTVLEYINLKKPVVVQSVLWTWTDKQGKEHIKFQGQRGKWSSANTVKENLTKKEALEIAKTTESKAFIEKLYK